MRFPLNQRAALETASLSDKEDCTLSALDTAPVTRMILLSSRVTCSSVAETPSDIYSTPCLK